ncbi:MAG TPA: AEC family transporter, partial [Caldilineaceae bacterium]|nr:AEC family transporter [Caldilineaceae bacterium]
MAGVYSLLPIFAQTVLPVFLVASAGFVLASFVPIDGRSVGRLLFYLATPCLVFRSLYQTQLDATALQHLALVAVTAAMVTGLLGWVVSAGQERKTRAAVVLTSAVSNNGNMGIPMSYYAFGDAGAALATVYYVIMSFMSNTFGAAVATAGQAGWRASLQQSLRVPVLYAATLGLVFNAANIVTPVPVMRAIDLLADAAIPGMLVLLGIQLRAAPILRGRTVVARSLAVRLLASPSIAWAICLLLGITGVER